MSPPPAQQEQPKSPPRSPASPTVRDLVRPRPATMEDFIVISDDSGSESSAGTRSGRARRLRRALSRTAGALPRRTVVSERASARRAPRRPDATWARVALLRDPRPGPLPLRPPPPLPHSCSRFPPCSLPGCSRQRGAADPGQGSPASRAPRSSRSGLGLESGGRAHARGPGAGVPEPTVGGSRRPGGGLLRSLEDGGGWRSGRRGRGGGPDLQTGTRRGNCLACGEYRCVQGRNRSPGPGPDGGRAPGPGSRAGARFWRHTGGDLFSLANIYQTLKE